MLYFRSSSQNIKRKGRGNTKTKTKAEDKTNNANQIDKKNKTEKQKKVKLKWRPMEKLEPGAKPPSFDGRQGLTKRGYSSQKF